MPRFALRTLLLIAFLGGILFTSCSALLPPQPPPPPPPQIIKENPRLEGAQRLLKQGKYKEAAAEFEAVLRADPSSAAAANGLQAAQKKLKEERDRIVQALIQLNERGLEFYHQNEYLKAGQTWKEALNLYNAQNDATLEQELPFPIDEVNGRLDQLVRLFMDRGVLLYRRGDLQNAIYAWQDVLLIQPEYTEAKDYIRKAQVKMETLDKLSSPAGPP